MKENVLSKWAPFIELFNGSNSYNCSIKRYNETFTKNRWSDYIINWNIKKYIGRREGSQKQKFWRLGLGGKADVWNVNCWRRSTVSQHFK